MVVQAFLVQEDENMYRTSEFSMKDFHRWFWTRKACATKTRSYFPLEPNGLMGSRVSRELRVYLGELVTFTSGLLPVI
jgi:hypothetical protein